MCCKVKLSDARRYIEPPARRAREAPASARIRDLAQFVAMLDSRVDQAERGGIEQRNGYLQGMQMHQETMASDDVEIPELETK